MFRQLEKFAAKAERVLFPIADALANQRHLKAVMSGCICALPLTIIGGLSLIVAFPPVDPSKVQDVNWFIHFMLLWKKWAADNAHVVLLPFNMTMHIMAVFIAIGIGYSLAKSYKLNPLSGAITSLVSFLLLAAPSDKGTLLLNVAKITDGINYDKLSKISAHVLPTDYLDAQGMFTAIIAGLISVEILRFCVVRKVTIKMPPGVPPAVMSAFESMIPLFLSFALFMPVTLYLKYSQGMLFPQLLSKVLAPLFSAVDTAWFAAGFAFCCQLLWFVGIHSVVIVGPILTPLLTQNGMANMNEMIAGLPLTHICTLGWWRSFTQLGGSGATLALVLLLLKSKATHLRTVGKVAIIPAIFNINEPVTFGVPLVFNPILAIPYLLVQPVNIVIAYYATWFGVVNHAFIDPPWTVPSPVCAFISTMDWRAPLLTIAIILLDMLLYYPFFKLYEKSLLKHEQAGDLTE